jgi:hypothetical protein
MARQEGASVEIRELNVLANALNIVESCGRGRTEEGTHASELGIRNVIENHKVKMQG